MVGGITIGERSNCPEVEGGVEKGWGGRKRKRKEGGGGTRMRLRARPGHRSVQVNFAFNICHEG